MTTIAEAETSIRAAAARIPGLELERVAEVRGTYAAVFSYRVNSTATKGFGTRWYSSLAELLVEVLDTIEHMQQGKGYDVNIFSTRMFEYLSAEMLPSDRPVVLTIREVKEETVAGPRGETVKVIVGFKERPKKLILNKTNARLLAKELTPETDNWIGATVTLGVETVKVGRSVVPSIRVRSATPATNLQPAGRNGRATMTNTVGDDVALRGAPDDEEMLFPAD